MVDLLEHAIFSGKFIFNFDYPKIRLFLAPKFDFFYTPNTEIMFSSGLPCNLSFPNCLSGGRSAKEDSSEELLPANMGNREPVILNVYDMVS